MSQNGGSDLPRENYTAHTKLHRHATYKDLQALCNKEDTPGACTVSDTHKKSVLAQAKDIN